MRFSINSLSIYLCCKLVATVYKLVTTQTWFGLYVIYTTTGPLVAHAETFDLMMKPLWFYGSPYIKFKVLNGSKDPMTTHPPSSANLLNGVVSKVETELLCTFSHT